jgi:hypothetical protein
MGGGTVEELRGLRVNERSLPFGNDIEEEPGGGSAPAVPPGAPLKVLRLTSGVSAGDASLAIWRAMAPERIGCGIGR